LANFRRLTTIYLGSGAAWIAYALFRPDLQRGTPWLLALLVLFSAGLALAAYLTWRGHPAAWSLGVGLQLLQLPHFRTEMFSWVVFSPVSLTVGWHESWTTFMASLETGATVHVGTVALPAGWTIGLNLAPLLALWLLDRTEAERRPPTIAPSAA
jgi:hypothetical protein